LLLRSLKERAQTAELHVPEFLVALQPLKSVSHRLGLEPAIHHATGLSSLDEPGELQDSEMLDKSRKRHAR
jgi:hypothetical protein